MKLKDEIIVAIVTGICIIGLALFFNRTVSEEVSILSKISPMFLFVIYMFTRGKKSKSKYDGPLFWSIGIILVSILYGFVFAY